MKDKFFYESSNDVLIQYFTTGRWGKVVSDDKYWDDELLMDRFIIFYVYCFARLNLPRPTRAQLEMAKFISNTKNPHRMMMAMRGLSKSLTSQIYVVWRLLNDPDEHILVMSAGATRAINYTQFVQKLIKLLPITSNMAPRHNIERTSGQSFDVAGASPSDSPSVYAVGAGNQVTGMRASLVIYDDIETAQTVSSVTLTEKINTYAMEAQNLLMSGKDESISLCTPHSMSSMYIGWIERGYKAFIIPAEYPEQANIANYFNSLAPFVLKELKSNEKLVNTPVDERLDADFLQSKKMRIGRSAYKLQYMLDVSDSDDLRFPLKLDDLIIMDVDDDDAPIKVMHSSMPDNRLNIKHNGFKANKMYAPAYVSSERMKYEMKIMSIDPAGRGQDEIGITIIYSLNTRLFIKKITGIEGGYEDSTMENICNLAAVHGIDTIVVESNYGDGAFLRMLEPFVHRICPMVKVDEIHVTGQKEKRIISTLEPLLNQHRIVMDKTTIDKDGDSGVVFSFTHQVSHITKEPKCLRHDDRLDSLSNGCIYMLDKMNVSEEFGFEKYLEEELEEISKLNDEMYSQYSEATSEYSDYTLNY